MANIDTWPFCHRWIHIKCNNLNDLDYKNCKLRNESWYCKVGIKEIPSFCSKEVNPNNINSENSSADPNLQNFLYQLNNLSEQETNENLPNCKYRDVSYFSNCDMKLKLKCLLFLHLNRNSLSNSFDDFNHLINDLNLNFDILGIS